MVDQVDDILDVWYGFLGSHPFLAAYLAPFDGEPSGKYLTRLRERFGRWVIGTCARPYDVACLAYAEENARRHHRTGRDRADAVDANPEVSLRYIIGFVYPISAPMRPFLTREGDDEGTGRCDAPSLVQGGDHAGGAVGSPVRR